jgi:hypothetical protein
MTEDKPAQFQFLDQMVKDSSLTPYYTPLGEQSLIESAMIWVDDPDPDNSLKLKTSWRFFFEVDDTLGHVPPKEGDLFRLSTLKPFRTGDYINFTVRGEDYSRDKAVTDMEKIAVVPNPYVAAATWEPRNPFRTGRGERRIYFINLPPQCTIRIYTVRGYLVDTIEHNGSTTNGSESWNLISKDGQDIAYGVYIYHVDAPGIGEKIDKFAVIK